jgi:hypothetical protein
MPDFHEGRVRAHPVAHKRRHRELGAGGDATHHLFL